MIPQRNHSRDRCTQFNQSMKRRIKFILLALLVGLIWVAGLVGYGLYTMEIEDQYGDLQELYYDSKTGDIIVNRKTFQFGIIEKNLKRINIRTVEKDSTDLYNWVNLNGVENQIEIYRPKIKLADGITYSELSLLIEKSELKLISKN